jgi:hypothetical protein
MINLTKKINKYYRTRNDILTAFGVDEMEISEHTFIANHISNLWYMENNTIHIFDVRFDDRDMIKYASRVGTKTIDGTLLFLCQGKGREYYSLFTAKDVMTKEDAGTFFPELYY